MADELNTTLQDSSRLVATLGALLVDINKIELSKNGDVYTITTTRNGETKSISWHDGKDGKDGKDGVDGVDGQDGYTPVKGVDYFDGQNGRDGRDGVDGYTPVKGVDYFDGADGADGQDGQDGYTPIKGVDYFDGKDGRDGWDGQNGKDGKDGTPVVSNTAPSDTDVLWIDPTDSNDDVPYVRTDVEQEFDDNQKETARDNIGAASAEDVTELSQEIVQITNSGETPTASGKVWTTTASGAGWADPQGGGGTAGTAEVVYFESNDFSAFKTLLQTATNKTVHLAPTVSVTVNAEIQLAEGIKIYGHGATIKRADGYTDLMVNMSNNCELRDVTINGNKDNVTSGTWERTVDLHINGNSNLVHNVTMINVCEGIMIVDNDNIVERCHISDCRGNGIHMGRSARTYLRNNVIKNTNLDTGTGYQNGKGCIYICRKVTYCYIENNWLENGLCGIAGLNVDNTLSASDEYDLYIRGNVIKSARQYAIEGQWQSSVANLSCRNILITSNKFIDSQYIWIANTYNNSIKSDTPLIISGNIFENTNCKIRSITGARITGNVIRNGSIQMEHCDAPYIGNNDIITTTPASLYFNNVSSAVVDGNHVVNNSTGNAYPIYIGEYCTKCDIINNTTSAPNTTNYIGIVLRTGCTAKYNNITFAKGEAITGTNYCVITHNVINATVSGLIAVRVWGGVSNVLITNNVANENASFAITTPSNSVVENNLTWTGYA